MQRISAHAVRRRLGDHLHVCSEARAALKAATRVLETLGVRINPRKTRTVHVNTALSSSASRSSVVGSSVCHRTRSGVGVDGSAPGYT